MVPTGNSAVSVQKKKTKTKFSEKVFVISTNISNKKENPHGRRYGTGKSWNFYQSQKYFLKKTKENHTSHSLLYVVVVFLEHNIIIKLNSLFAIHT